MPETVDLPTLRQRLASAYGGLPLGSFSTPPDAATGRCGVCGVLLARPETAAHGAVLVPPLTDVALDVLLCEEHAGSACRPGVT